MNHWIDVERVSTFFIYLTQETHLHDSYTQGCQGSIIVEDSPLICTIQHWSREGSIEEVEEEEVRGEEKEEVEDEEEEVEDKEGAEEEEEESEEEEEEKEEGEEGEEKIATCETEFDAQSLAYLSCIATKGPFPKCTNSLVLQKKSSFKIFHNAVLHQANSLQLHCMHIQHHRRPSTKGSPDALF